MMHLFSIQMHAKACFVLPRQMSLFNSFLMIYFLEGVDPETGTQEIFECLKKYGQVSNVIMNVEIFNNKKIPLDSAFVLTASDVTLDTPIFIHGREARPIRIGLPESPAKAILLGDSSQLTPAAVTEAIPGSVKLTRRRISKTFYYILEFPTEEQRNTAVTKFSRLVINESIFSLRSYATYPKPQYKVACAIKSVQSAKVELLKLIHQGTTWAVNPHLAALASGTLKRHLERHGIEQPFEVAHIQGDFTPIFEVLWHRPCTQHPGRQMDYKFMYLMGAHLNIPELLRSIEGVYYLQLDKERALEGLNLTSTFGHGMEPHICYLASHINKVISDPSFTKLPVEILKQIFASKHFDGTKKSVDMMKELVGGEDLRCFEAIKYAGDTDLAKESYEKWISSASIDLNEVRGHLSELILGQGNAAQAGG